MHIYYPPYLRKFAMLAFLFVSGIEATAQSTAPETILLPWTERRPFQYVDSDGKLKGILFDLGEKIFAKAGVPMKWVEIPANRIIATLEKDEQPICLVGWFKTPEREKIANATLPIYRDKPIRGVFRSGARIKQAGSFKEIADEHSVKVMVKQGYSYGTKIDALLAARNDQNVHKTSVDHLRMLQMIQLNRADIMLLPQEEIDFYVSTDPDFYKAYSVIRFNDLPNGNLRHILCGKRIPSATVEKLNKAIKASIAVK